MGVFAQEKPAALGVSLVMPVTDKKELDSLLEYSRKPASGVEGFTGVYKHNAEKESWLSWYMFTVELKRGDPIYSGEYSLSRNTDTPVRAKRYKNSELVGHLNYSCWIVGTIRRSQSYYQFQAKPRPEKDPRKAWKIRVEKIKTVKKK